MKFEKIYSDKFAAFKQVEILGELHKINGGLATPGGSKNMGGDSCTMTYGSDCSDEDGTVYYESSYDGCDCPES